MEGAKLRRAGTLAAAGLACWLLAGQAIRLLWPLLCALALSAAIRRPVDWLASRRILPRPAACAVLTLICLVLAAGAFWLALSLCIYGLERAMALLPGLLSRLRQVAGPVLEGAAILQQRLPDMLRQAPLFTAEGLTGWLTPEKLGLGKLLTALTRWAVDLPELVFCLVFLFVATFYLTLDRVRIWQFLHRQLTARQSMAVIRLKEFLGTALTGWLRAQAALAAATFCVSLAGFWLLGLPYPVLLAAGTALVDALPVLGSGAVLVPGAGWCLLTGATGRALGLVALYGAALTVRNALEPRLVSMSLGLHPFVTLICIFFGFRLAGVAGMFLAPVAVLSASKLREWGYVRLWK